MIRRLLGGPYHIPTHICKGGMRVAGSTTHLDPVPGRYTRKCRVCKQKFIVDVIPLSGENRQVGEFLLFKGVWVGSTKVAE
jgi:hypothetical protein